MQLFFEKLKGRLASTNIVQNLFIFKICNRRYKYLLLGHGETYFVKDWLKYSEDAWVSVRRHFHGFCCKDSPADTVFGIPMGTNCVSLLAGIFLYLYEVEFIQLLLSTGRKQFASTFNTTYSKQPRVWEIHGPGVSCWTWHQRHDREQHFCSLPRYTTVDRDFREGRST